MVVTVSAMFAICWVTDLTLHVFDSVASYNISPVIFSVAHTMIMFNSAVNPFAYALINHRFREKMKGMIRCSARSSAPRVYATKEPQDIEMINDTSQPSDRHDSNSVNLR